MPSATLFARRRIYRASLLAAMALLIAVSTSVITTRVAFACPDERTPLRSLYMNSDLVVVARVGPLVPVQLADSSDENSDPRYLTRRDLRVDVTLKGEANQSAVPLYGPGWAYEGHIADELSDYGTEKLLLFLTKREDGGGYEIGNSAAGIKKLSEKDLEVYVERLKELDHIVRQDNPDPAQIVEWLVRCAEEPATRWEGLQELSMSNYLTQENFATEPSADKVEENTDGNAPTESEPSQTNHAAPVQDPSAQENSNNITESTPEDSVEVGVIPRGYAPEYGPELVRLLTDDQKRRLSNVFFGTKTLTYDEIMFIDLVREWDEPRVIPFLLSQLRGFTENPPTEAEILVNVIAEKLKDEELTNLAASYSRNASYNDETADEIAAGEPQVQTAETAVPDAGTQAEVQVVAQTEAEATPDELKDDPTVVGTDREKRSIRLGRFINRVQYLLR